MAGGESVEDILSRLKECSGSRNFRVKAASIIESIALKLGLPVEGSEYTLISSTRVDSPFTHIIVVYEATEELSGDLNTAEAVERIAERILRNTGVKEHERPLLVILGSRVVFARYDSKSKRWVLKGPYDLGRRSLLMLLTALRSLKGRRLSVDELLEDFGSTSPLTKRAVRVLYEKLTESNNQETRGLLEHWRKTSPQANILRASRGLEELRDLYGIEGRVDYEALLLSVYTYYAFLMKLLAASVAYPYGTGRYLESYVDVLEEAYASGLNTFKKLLMELESGVLFKSILNIANYSGDSFTSWYLEELDEELAEVLITIARRLSEYEPAAMVLDLEYPRDLLKELYQNLVPREVRRSLGEYYTPDWLADLVLSEAGITVENFEKLAEERGDPLAPLNLRILDPACGSGTFLILAVKKLREYAEKQGLEDHLAGYLPRSVVGFDLNPLAVLAARTNYLLVVADLLPFQEPFEIPVYLADPLSVEVKVDSSRGVYVVRTLLGELVLPVKAGDKEFLRKLVNAVAECMRVECRVEEFKEVAERGFNLSENEVQLVAGFYSFLLKLEDSERDSMLRSILALLAAGSYKGFDYVIGNPPWVNWEKLPLEYRRSSKTLWESYGLLKSSGRARLGRVKRDISMLFLARSLDSYVREKGVLAFLVPFSVFKSQAGAGLRGFLASRGRILRIHDLVELTPFENAVNMTSLIVVEKEGETRFPVPCVLWRSSRRIRRDASLEEAVEACRRLSVAVIPVSRRDPGSPWMEVSWRAYRTLKKITGSTPWYKAYEGVNTALNQVYWIKVLSEVSSNLLLVTNPPLPGQKKKVKQVEQVVERDLVYPLVRGRSIRRWLVERMSEWIIIPHDPVSGKPIPEDVLKAEYPRTYEYLASFKEELEDRSIHKLWGRGKPFYTLYDIGGYTFKPYKVAWKYIAGGVSGKARFSAAVLEPVSDQYVGVKTVIPNEKLVIVPLEDRSEAYYLAGILNSSPIILLVSSYALGTAISTHILEYIRVPKYDPGDPLHRKLSMLSEEAHKVARLIHGKDRANLKNKLKRIEAEIDSITAQLYNITEKELRDIISL